MRSTIAISVIVRTINRPGLLRDALQSLANQTCRDFEIVVVDMSKDSVRTLLQAFAGMIPKIQHIETGTPLQRSDALNLGIRNAVSDKIAILDDDDVYDPNHLAVLIQGLERSGAELVYTGVRVTTYTREGTLIDTVVRHDEYDFAALVFRCYICTTGTAFWKKTWERVGAYDPRFPAAEDHDFILRVGDGHIARLPEITAEARSFTGIPGVRHHNLEKLPLGRCTAGLFWVHWSLYDSESFAACTEYLKHKEVSERHIKNIAGNALARRVAIFVYRKLTSKAGLRLFYYTALIKDLPGWWWFYARPFHWSLSRRVPFQAVKRSPFLPQV